MRNLLVCSGTEGSGWTEECLSGDEKKGRYDMPAVVSQIVCLVAIIVISAIVVITDKRPQK